jgi:predicted site-specific integrase-resolvase
MPEKLYTTGEVAKIFGVSYVAVKAGLLGEDKVIKTPGGKYRYPESETKRLLGEAPKGRVAIYARVSSADQKEDLERQKQRLVEYAKSKGYKLHLSSKFYKFELKITYVDACDRYVG